MAHDEESERVFDKITESLAFDDENVTHDEFTTRLRLRREVCLTKAQRPHTMGQLSTLAEAILAEPLIYDQVADELGINPLKEATITRGGLT